MTRTFLDSGVLIALTRGRVQEVTAAKALLEYPGRKFFTSPFVHLEVMPHSRRLGRQADIEILETFFSNAAWIDDLPAILDQTRRILELEGLKLADALHVAAAALAGADEFVTTEGPSKPLRRTKLIRVVPLL
jgi:predicted nucleic acid-binding protein